MGLLTGLELRGVQGQTLALVRTLGLLGSAGGVAVALAIRGGQFVFDLGDDGLITESCSQHH
jgi:hypothetical protein